MSLDRVVILRVSVQVHSDVEMQQRLLVPLELHVHLPQLEVHTCLLGRQATHLLEVCQGLVETFKGHKHASLLEIRHAILWLALGRPVEVLERHKRAVQGVEHHSEVATQNRVGLVDLHGLQKVVARILVLLLTVVDVAKAPPSVVVPRVNAQSLLVHRNRLVELLVRHEFMPAECVGVRIGWVHLYRTLEELYRNVVLFLEAEAIAHDTPDLGLQSVPLQTLLRQVAKFDVLPKMPQRRGVVLQALKPARLYPPNLLEN
mmetsp:Transcript_100760/g.215997  ORF Transcript_100760/g.215997 Transcript_100760/m.215997 type:complete len:260 (+) Transcript_100760:1179-1958(+)